MESSLIKALKSFPSVNLVCANSLESGLEKIMKTDCCVVITAGKLGDGVFAKDLALKAHNKKNVEAMCVFCGPASIAINKKWVSDGNYTKVNYVGANYKALTNKVVDAMTTIYGNLDIDSPPE